jgi:NTP pyrophosphatase (non-canonical NTP hydrolase)
MVARTAERMRCPLCGKQFATGRAGWDGHVGAIKLHPSWHPDVLDAEKRKRLFREEFPGFFADPREPAAATLQQLSARAATFVDERHWREFHSPRNLAAGLSVEAAEVLEHFQWLTDEQSRALTPEKLDKVADELGDVLIYVVRLADELGIDLLDAASQKLDKNSRRYPAHLVRGDARKYDEY